MSLPAAVPPTRTPDPQELEDLLGGLTEDMLAW